MKKAVFVIVVLCLAAFFITSCGSNDDIDMKKFIDKMKKENRVSPEKKQEIRRSIFPNLKE